MLIIASITNSKLISHNNTYCDNSEVTIVSQEKSINFGKKSSKDNSKIINSKFIPPMLG